MSFAEVILIANVLMKESAVRRSRKEIFVGPARHREISVPNALGEADEHTRGIRIVVDFGDRL